MRVPCPACAACYEIPDVLLQRTRRLRCAACSHEWRLEAPPPSGTQPGEPAVSAEPVDVPAGEGGGFGALLPPMASDPLLVGHVGSSRLASMISRTAGLPAAGWLLPLIWLLSLAVVASGLVAGWHWRGTIGLIWPPSLRLFQLLPHGVPG